MSEVPPRREPESTPGFTLFAFLWCLAVLYHQLFQGRFAVLDATTPLTFAALWGLLRPGSLPRFLVVLAVHLATVVYEMPEVVNHWLLMGVTCLGLLVVLLPFVPALRRGDFDARILTAVLPSVRAQLVIVYALATLAKLNAGFLDPAHSCGAEHYRRLAASVPLLPVASWAIHTAIVGTLVIEAALPLLLAIPRTRPLALVAGWVFHLMLGWNGYWDFSMVAAAYYSTFVPPRLLAGGRLAAERSPRLRRLRDTAARWSASPAAFPVAAALLLVPAGLAALGGRPEAEMVMLANRLGRGLWLVTWGVLGLLLLAAFRNAPAAVPEPPPPARRPVWLRPALLLAPLLVFVNGLSPYLGLKTENSYTMFSNLRTEGDVWNHYVMPRWLRVFHYQDEPVRIVRSSDPTLERLAKAGFRLTPFALHRLARQVPDAALIYQTSRGRQVVRRVADDPELGRPVDPLLGKLLLFRPIPPPERNVCLH